jgi:hypothetical protein
MKLAPENLNTEKMSWKNLADQAFSEEVSGNGIVSCSFPESKFEHSQEGVPAAVGVVTDSTTCGFIEATQEGVPAAVGVVTVLADQSDMEIAQEGVPAAAEACQRHSLVFRIAGIPE